MKRVVFIFLLIFLQAKSYASQLDSLALLIKYAKSDTQKIAQTIKLSELLLDINPDSALTVLKTLHTELKQKINQPAADSLLEKKYLNLYQKNANNLGYYYAITGQLDSSLVYFNHCLDIARKLGDIKHQAEIYNNLGFVANRKGDVYLALDYYLNSLKIKEQYANPADVALAYNNVASIYLKQKEYDKAIEYFNKSVELLQQSNNERTLAIIEHNLGHAYLKNHEPDKAEQMLLHSKMLKQKLSLQSLLPPTLLDLGDVYMQQKQYDKALLQFEQALLIAEALDNKEFYDNALIRIASAYFYQNNIRQALIYAKKAKIYADRLNYPELKKEAALVLSRIYRELHDYQNAFRFFNEYITYRDSLFNEELRENTIKKQMAFEYQRKRLVDSLAMVKEKAVQQLIVEKQQAELETQKTQKKALIAGVVLLIIIAGLIFYSFTKTKYANRLIKKQKQIVEQKNQEITDSINYAKRIQDAVINRNEVNTFFPNHFVLFKPKDIVSGDFYWSKVYKDAEGNVSIHIAVADCTGHGVPGAFMSLLGISYLNEIVTENTRSAAEVLNTLRAKIIDNLRHVDENKVIRDGMDISYCIITFNQQHEVAGRNICLKYAGAFNPLYIISDVNECAAADAQLTGEENDKTLFELKANRQSIGYISQMVPFTEKEVWLHHNDRIYLFTDGYADQFGGEKGKKLKYKPFKRLLLATAGKPVSEQSQAIESFLSEWMKSYEQTDDITVIGVEISGMYKG